MPSFTIGASTVVGPAGLLDHAEVVIADGRIEAVRQARGPVPDRVLCPGFIDLQVNGHGDAAVATAAGAEWDRLDRLLLAQGVTAWCPTLITAPLPSFEAPLSRITAAAGRPPDLRRPVILGAHLEGPFLGVAGAHPRQHLAPVDLDWLRRLPAVVRVVTLAPELAGATAAIELLAGRGVLVGLGHSAATYEQALTAAAAGARLVTHLFNGMSPLHHREPGLAGAALADDRLTPSLIADGVHVHPDVLATAVRAKGAGRWVLVTDSVAWDRGGAPRLPDGTLAGSALTMDAAVRRMVHDCRLPLAEVVAAATATPAALLGLDDRGRLVPGARADLVALTPDLEVEEVWVGT